VNTESNDEVSGLEDFAVSRCADGCCCLRLSCGWYRLGIYEIPFPGGDEQKVS
jgi:hypothetical protein